MSLSLHASLFGLSAAAAHLLTMRFFPSMLTHIARLKVGAKTNEVYHHGLLEAETTTIVKPCPDLLYSGCYYDLRAGALTFHVPKQVEYFSVAGYAADTTCFFVMDDRDCSSDALTFALVSPERAGVSRTGECVVSPSRTGFVIVRALVSDHRQLPEMVRRQRGIQVNPVAPNKPTSRTALHAGGGVASV